MSNVYILPRNQRQQRAAAIIPVGRVVRTGRVMKPVVQPNRMPLGHGRRVYLAPAVIPHQQSFHGQNRMTPQFVDHSEEDEFDMEEVYHLLEESAGHRLQDSPAPPRRRERLTNLTQEEKLNRRKQKNRIAAQAARDRKKETTKRLEDSLKRALLEIGRLKTEVRFLQAENAQMRGARGNSIYSGQEMALNEQQHFYQQQPIQMQPRQRYAIVEPKQHQNRQSAQLQPNDQMAERQQQPDSLGSAASFSEPLPRERESSSSSRTANDNNRHNGQAMSSRPSSLAMMGAKERKLRMACLFKERTKLDLIKREENSPSMEILSNSDEDNDCLHPHDDDDDDDHFAGSDGHLVGGFQQGGGQDNDDFKLQQIFDELFEELDVPVDVDRFCNEVIEEGIAAANAENGYGQTEAFVQQQPAAVGGTFVGSARDNGQSESQGKAENAIGEYPHQYQPFGQNVIIVGGGRATARGNRAPAEVALSPHNYCHTAAQNHHHHEQHQQQHYFYENNNQQHQSISSSDSKQSDNGLSPAYQTVPSPMNPSSNFVCQQNSPLYEPNNSNYHTMISKPNHEEDPMLFEKDQLHMDNTEFDFEFGHNEETNQLLGWPDEQDDFHIHNSMMDSSGEVTMLGAEEESNSLHEDDQLSQFLASF